MNATLTKRHHITNTQAGSEVFQVRLYKALKKHFPSFVFNCRLTEKHDETPVRPRASLFVSHGETKLSQHLQRRQITSRKNI